jgi:hypothetical protein
VLAISKLLLLRCLAKGRASGEDLSGPSIMNLYAAANLVNRLALTLSLMAMVFGLFWLVWILATTCSSLGSAACR